MICAAEGSTERVVRFLIQHGADVFVKALMLRGGIGGFLRQTTTGDPLEAAKKRMVTGEPPHTSEVKNEIIATTKEAQREAKRKKKQQGGHLV